MPYLTNLADVARKAGLKVVETNGWQNRGHGPMDADIRTIVVHHTASGAKSGNAPSLNTVKNGRPGLAGPLAHYLLARDGTVYVVAAGLAWHAGQVRHIDYTNRFSIGIEAENNGVGEPWSAEQMDAYAKLCAALVIAFGLDATDVLGHKEVCYPAGRKIDPTFNMADFRREVRREVAAFRAARSAPRSAPAVTLHRILKYRPIPRLYRGSDVAAVQRKVGATPDGVFGRQTRTKLIAFQKAHHLKPDGVVGANTAHAMGFGWRPA